MLDSRSLRSFSLSSMLMGLQIWVRAIILPPCRMSRVQPAGTGRSGHWVTHQVRATHDSRVTLSPSRLSSHQPSVGSSRVTGGRSALPAGSETDRISVRRSSSPHQRTEPGRAPHSTRAGATVIFTRSPNATPTRSRSVSRPRARSTPLSRSTSQVTDT